MRLLPLKTKLTKWQEPRLFVLVHIQVALITLIAPLGVFLFPLAPWDHLQRHQEVTILK